MAVPARNIPHMNITSSPGMPRPHQRPIDAGNHKLPRKVPGTGTRTTRGGHSMGQILIAAAMLCCSLPLAHAETAAQRDARMAWFREARFGMFIHWGLYSVPAGEWNGNTNYGEWFLEETKMPVSQYEKFAGPIQPGQIRCSRLGAAGQGGGHEIHRHHLQTPRRIRAVDSKVSD